MTLTTGFSAEKIRIYPQGPELSRVIYGTWRLLDGQDETIKKPDVILKRIQHCIARGVTTFDLADIYGGGQHQCERAFGQALALEPSLRSQMQLVTKCGIVIPRVEGQIKIYDTSKEYILQRVQESLDAVGTEYFDILLIHRPDPFMNADEVAEAMNELKQSGKVKYFGVSNFNCSQVDLLQSRLDQYQIPLVTNQIEFSLLHLNPLYNGVLDQCQRLRMLPMIWSPLAGGRLVKSSAEDSSNLFDIKNEAKLIAAAHGKSVNIDQVCYAWINVHPSGGIPIVGSNKIERIDAAVDSLQVKMSRYEWFKLLHAAEGKTVP